MKATTDLNYINRFIGFTGTYAGAGAAVLGTLEAKTSSGEMAPVNTHGILFVEAGGTLTVGAKVKSDANGRAVIAETGIDVGIVLDATTTVGEIVRIKI